MQGSQKMCTFAAAKPRCSAVGSVPGLGPGCRRFESCHLDFHNEPLIQKESAVFYVFVTITRTYATLSIEPIGNYKAKFSSMVRTSKSLALSHYESKLRRLLEGKCSNILKINSKISFKTTALSKKCSIFAALFLMKDEYQGLHQSERRIYILSRSKGEITLLYPQQKQRRNPFTTNFCMRLKRELLFACAKASMRSMKDWRNQ